jgi:hypothetical protein
MELYVFVYFSAACVLYEDDIQYSLQIPLIGNTALVQEIAASCTS